MPALLDVVVLVHDVPSWTDLCIRAIEAHTKNSFKLIIVDNASQLPQTKAILQSAESRGAKLVRLAENRSFSNGINAGVRAGDSRFVAIVNNDAIVTEGWDSALLQDIAEKTVGMAGARSNYVAGAQGDGGWPSTREPPYLAFVTVALRREVWTAVGPLDEETFDGFSTEDIDYSWRVQKAGYKLKVSSAFVLHAGSRTLLEKSAGQPEALAKNNAKYNARLTDKWGKDFALEHSRTQSSGVVVTYHPNEYTRVDFMKHLMGLRKSDNVGFSYLQIIRAPIHVARQTACDWAVENGFDWIVQLDDDATFPPDLLRRLLSHGKEIVTGLAYQRKIPHNACVFELGEDGLLGAPMNGIENTGLRRVDVSGYHCSIVHSSVIKKMRAAGIRQYFGGFENKVGEDFAFSLNCKKIGVQIWCDTDLISGHIGASAVVDAEYKRLYALGQIPSHIQLR